MKTILVPTDFSPTADFAIRYAYELAGLYEGSIILYHTFIPFESGFYSPEQRRKDNLETENNLVRRLTTIRETISTEGKNIPIDIQVDRGPSSVRLLEFCKKKNIDLIVMGTTGATGLKEVVIGSFTADIMTSAPCPVLAIPNGYQFRMPQTITYASDYLSNEIPAIRYLLALNEFFKAKINFLHIDDTDVAPAESERQFEGFRQAVESNFPGLSLSFRHIAAEDIALEIVKTAINENIDLLAMSPVRREGFWDCLMKRSVTKTIAHQIPIPLLAIPDLS